MASGVIGNSLRVIARRGGDHSAGAFLRRQREQLVQSAPLFECSSALLVIQLEKDGIVRQPGKCFGMRARGDADVGANSA